MKENLITKNNIEELIKFKNEIDKYRASKEKSFDLSDNKKTTSLNSNNNKNKNNKNNKNNKPIDFIKTINKLKDEANVDIDDELEGIVYDKRQIMQDKFINLNKKENKMRNYYQDLLDRQKLTNAALEFKLEQLLKHRKDMTMEIRYDDFEDY